MLHELDSHEDSIFVTLTYAGEKYDFGSLCKPDLQKFMKRLRRNIGERKIKYFACGEYGEQFTQRPHYHLIIFGMSLKPEDKQIISDSWSLGLVDFGIAEQASIAYTAQYIDKKFSGDKAIEEYDCRYREPVFRVSSIGLGKNYAIKHEKQIRQQGHVSHAGIKQSIPRYYLKVLGIDKEELKELAYIKECDVVHKYSGYDYSRDEAYNILKPDEVRMIEDGIKMAKQQHDKNLIARINLKTRKL